MLRQAVLVVSALTSLASPAVWADELAGQIQIVVGAAQLIDASGKARPLERGSQVRQGDRVVTEEGALVQLKLTDGTLVAVRTNTDVSIEKYRYDDKTAQNSSLLLKLARGALRSITGLIGGSNPEAYKVATPTATIGIRGTDHEPVYIPEPKPGETPIGTPGTYDKVNSGATVIVSREGVIDIKPGQVGFVPIAPGTAPKLLPAVPDFFKRLDPKSDGAGKGNRELGNQKFLARPQLKQGLDPEIKPIGVVGEKAIAPIDPLRTEKTLSPTLIEAAPTLQTAPKLEAVTTTLAPINTAIAPTTTLAPINTAITPTMIVAPTTITQPAPTISPTLTPKLITPILLK